MIPKIGRTVTGLVLISDNSIRVMDPAIDSSIDSLMPLVMKLHPLLLTMGSSTVVVPSPPLPPEAQNEKYDGDYWA